jgi:dsDNA-specific endonuclease/ATPase MutS2
LGATIFSENDRFEKLQKEQAHIEQKWREHYESISKDLRHKVLELTETANEAAKTGLSLPEHR